MRLDGVAYLILRYDYGAYDGYNNRKVGDYLVDLVLIKLCHFVLSYFKVSKLSMGYAVFLYPLYQS